MADGSGAAGARYRAFISYSHRDAVFAGRLHRRLEGYVLPKRLGAERRLTPIFKDREELPAAQDLSAQVRAALAVSECLIVVCSPDAAASPWVGREIELFRELHPDRPILAVLVRGEPVEAFPPALAAGGVEPLAADFRKDADGERLALLKLVAGVAGIGVDQLVQRDAQRRLRAVMAVTGGALAGMLAMGLTAAFALSARAEAERQRTRAEGLVEFMATDLKVRLEGIGRLDIQTAVNDRALAYYSSQDPDQLRPDSLLRYARLLHAKGDVETKQENLSAADASFAKANLITSRLLDRDPTHTERLWTHAQSAYWLGFVEFRRGSAAGARRHWEKYEGLAQQLAKQAPTDPRTIEELGFSEGNLCTLAVEMEKNPATALRSCSSSLATMEKASSLGPPSIKTSIAVANRHGWMADAWELNGKLAQAKAERLNQERLINLVLARDPKNQDARDNWVGSQRGLSRIAFRQGDIAEARRRMSIARGHLQEMVAADSGNKLWRRYLLRADREWQFLNENTPSEKRK